MLAFLSCAAGSAHAQQGAGLRAGVSADPDQFYFGGHWISPALADRLHFRPNVEVGLGDDLTLVAFNIEFAYRIPLDREWRLYFGGGPALNLYSFDQNGDDDSETEGGFNILVGLDHRSGLMFEFKVGAIDSPDLKFGVGYTFR